MSSRLRVLHLIYDDPGSPWVAGGGSVRVLELYRRLTATVDATVATGRFPGARDELIDGVRYRRLGAAAPYALSRLTYAAAANRLLRTAAYDAAVFDFSGYTPVFVPRRGPVGITVHHLTGPTAGARWGRAGGAAITALERRMLRRARYFSATSAATLHELREVVGDASWVELIHAGVPDELYDLPRRPRGDLLYFGRLDVFQKGLDTLIDAFALISADHPRVRLVIAGRGKDAARVADMVDRAGLTDRVETAGAVSEAHRQRLFSEAAVLLMPSRFEGFGMVAAEAMAAGLPVVAAASGSLPEVVDPPNGGVLVPPEDPRALAAAVDRLLRSPDARDGLGASARRSAERFRWDAVAARHLEFLRRIAGAGSATNSDHDR